MAKSSQNSHHRVIETHDITRKQKVRKQMHSMGKLASMGAANAGLDTMPRLPSLNEQSRQPRVKVNETDI